MSDAGNTAWILASAALVLFMTPGLAFFYGGLVKSKSVISMLMMSFGAMGIVGVLWVLYGYSFAFGNDIGLVSVIGCRERRTSIPAGVSSSVANSPSATVT